MTWICGTLSIHRKSKHYFHAPSADNRLASSGIKKGTHPEDRPINGAVGPSPDDYPTGAETMLDVSIASSLVWPQDTVVFQVEDELYQLAQQAGSPAYSGFFNSARPSPIRHGSRADVCRLLERH